MFDTVIFDLGGVLVDWNPDYVFAPIFQGDAARRQYFYEHVCTHDWNEQQDAGVPLQQATEERVRLFPDWEPEIRAFYGRWEEMLGGPIQGTVDILEQLRQQDRHRLVALTNWSAETFPIALDRYDFLHWFEGILVSGVEKTRKPFPEFFELLFERYAIDPRRAIFIDDNLRNVEAGRALGLTSVRFESSSQLSEELKRLQISAR
ncbi:HAD family hydrolase [Aureliella helgolandensis]|uniref:Alpha-D-glucose-1-phosphate phosphatase YihX n=1 Tax=Aureliella helgolandensis TaxID=2527968 RepID=A0A518GH97_9BACT|nr:HAD family phosphatase [Aureliella helgolandensis]QDV27938.1 Alpha-D-glucose-1-phosphate phosphatase YihX [Aureliella helgolandensis]